MDRARARRGLSIYFGVLVVASAAIEAWLIAHGGLQGPWGWLVVVLMYVPLLSSVVARLANREGFGDVSFRWGGATGTRAALVAWLIPIAVGFLAYGVAWSAGLAVFTVPDQAPLGAAANPLVRLLASFPAALTLGTLVSCLFAFGEEVGWRGYLVPRLVEAGVRAPLLTSSLVWCAWHVPLILWGGYAVGPYPVLSALLFAASITPVGLLLGRWRLATGSVWPAVIAHGAWNEIIQSVFDRWTTGEAAALWVGESGVLSVAAVWLAYAAVRRARWAGTVRADGLELAPVAGPAGKVDTGRTEPLGQRP
jgi:membrane protease YdiL (CAAX protease family)